MVRLSAADAAAEKRLLRTARRAQRKLRMSLADPSEGVFVDSSV